MRRTGKIASYLLFSGVASVFAGNSSPLSAQPAGGIPGVVAPGVQPQLVQENFTFVEGPVGAADGSLYFSDIRVNKTYHLDTAGKINVIRENTRSTNGLALTKDGDLLGAEGDGNRISKRARNGTVTIVVDSYNGMPLLSPNDLIVDSKGGIYFTVPGPRPVVPGRPTYVLYLPANSKQPVLIDNAVPRPNGIVLSMDGKTLIVDDTLGPDVFAYDIQPDGSGKNKRVFARLHDLPAGQESGADGMGIDRDNRIYVTTVVGVQVFDAKGAYLGTIKAARQAANVAFAGPNKQVLYLTAREGLYRINTIARGPDRLGK